MKIDDATADTSIGGSEKIPVSDAGSPKSITVSGVKDFVLAALAASASDTPAVSTDGLYVIKGGVTKQVTASALSDAIAAALLGKTAASITTASIIVCKTGTSIHCCTMADIVALATAAGVSVSGMTSADALATGDLALVTQSGANKKTTLGAIRTFVEANLATYIASCAAVTTVGSTDAILMLTGGAIKTVQSQYLLASAGDVTGPASTTEDNLPQWDSTTKKLKDGLALTASIADVPSGTKIPTEAAVRAAITAASGVTPPATPVADNIPQWGTGDDLTSGLSVQTEVRTALTATDTAVPTEKAVRDALAAETIAPPLSHAENAIPQWGAANELKGGVSLVTSVRSTGQVDTAVPTEKAVRSAVDAFTASIDAVSAALAAKKLDDLAAPDDNTDLDASTAKHGLMSKADKTKLDSLENEGALEEIGAALADDDTIAVTDTSATAKKKTLVSRVWTYVSGKLAAFKLDDLAAPDDNTDLNASTSAHGLLPKLSGAATEFLNGTGAFSTPAGNTPFTGDSGTGGAHGLVPAPAAGDGAAAKFLSAGGTWAEPGVAVGVDIAGETAIDAVAAGDELYVYDISESAYRKATSAQLAAYVNGIARYDTLWVPAGAITPANSDGAVSETFTIAANTTVHDVLRFLHTKDTLADFNAVMPDDWDGGAVKVKAYWLPYNADGAEGQYVRFTLAGAMFGDGEALTGALGTAANIDDQFISANQIHVSAAVSLAVAGTAAAGKMIHFKMTRDYDFNNGGGGVAMATGACLLGVLIQYKKSISTTEW